MKCSEARDLISEYIDGTLGPKERAELEAHMKECAECREGYEELKKTIASIQEVGETVPPPWFAEKVMAQVREEASRKKRTGLIRRLFGAPGSRVPATAIVIVFVAVVTAFVLRSVGPGKFMQVAQKEPQPSIARKAVPAPSIEQPAGKKDLNAEDEMFEKEMPREEKPGPATLPSAETAQQAVLKAKRSAQVNEPAAKQEAKAPAQAGTDEDKGALRMEEESEMMDRVEANRAMPGAEGDAKRSYELYREPVGGEGGAAGAEGRMDNAPSHEVGSAMKEPAAEMKMREKAGEFELVLLADDTVDAGAEVSKVAERLGGVIKDIIEQKDTLAVKIYLDSEDAEEFVESIVKLGSLRGADKLRKVGPGKWVEVLVVIIEK